MILRNLHWRWRLKSPHFFSKIFIYYVFSIVFGKEPDLTREGGSIPVTLSLQNATETSVILLPMGASDDGAHSQNEKLNVYNYINGVIFSLFISDTFYSRMSDKITNFGPKILYFLRLKRRNYFRYKKIFIQKCQILNIFKEILYFFQKESFKP